MAARSPAQARFLGLWTAGWLALLLVAGMLRFGDPAVQWPVLVVPALWALVALRPRRASRAGGAGSRRPGRSADEWAEDRWADDEEAEDRWVDDRWAEDGRADDPWAEDGRTRDAGRWPPPGERTDTVERPALRRRSDGTDRWR
ncbi:hypothetical protein ACI8AG_17720 [Blastococcus sp. SYSU DS0552]